MRIKKFTNYITEAKNLHMEHLEDSLFNEGSVGVGEAIRFLESVADMLSGNAGSEFGVTVKWDGAFCYLCRCSSRHRKVLRVFQVSVQQECKGQLHRC